MKDRRAVTVQHMVVRGVTADRSVCVRACVCVCVGCATSRLLPSHQAAVCCRDVWRGEGGGGRSSAKVWGLQLRGGPPSHGGPLGQPVLHPCTRGKGEHGSHVSHTSSPSTPWHMNQLLPSNPWWPFVCTQPAVAMARGVVLEWTDAHQLLYTGTSHSEVIIVWRQVCTLPATVLFKEVRSSSNQ